MRISVIAPVKNEVDFIGYSIMAILPYIHEIIYTVSPASDDGTIPLLEHIQNNYARGKLRYLCNDKYEFNPHDLKAYNQAFNDCLQAITGDAAWFLHPDMIVTNPEAISAVQDGPLAWFTNITSYAGDLKTRITAGRATKWKNIASKQFGLHYYGAYGSQNEDFYFKDITGESYKHYGEAFEDYPYEIGDSGIKVNHYCELKTYKRRFEKMKLCLKTLFPAWDENRIEEVAMNHPRVTLEPSNNHFGVFQFAESDEPIPEVFSKYRAEFEQFKNILCPA